MNDETGNGDIATWLEKITSVLNSGNSFCRIAAFAVTSIFLFTGCLIFVDTICRYFLNSPLTGVSAVTGLALVAAAFLTLAYTQQEKAHVTVDFFLRYFPPRGKIVLNNIFYCLALGIVALMTWRSIAYTLYLHDSGIIIAVLNIPIYPFTALLPFGFVMLAFVLLRDLFNNVAEGLKLNLGNRLWLLSLVLLVLIIAGMVFWVWSSPFEVNRPIFGLVGLLVSVLVFMIGIPLAFVLLLLSFVFLTTLNGVDASLVMIGSFPFRMVNTDTWAVVALFILMGYIVSSAGFGGDLYYSAYKWLGHLPGGLAQATIGAATAFAGAVGDCVSSTVTFSAVAMPEMKKFNYNESLCTGVVCAGATLGPMIPPSMSFIIYGLLTTQSIGKLFIAGIVPGLLLALGFMIYTHTLCKLRPGMGPSGPASSVREKFVSLKLAWPIVTLFLMVIGGMYAGIVTPNEAGGIGLAGALIIGVAVRRLNRQNLTSAILGAGSLIGMLFLLIVGSMLFGYFIAASDVQIVFEKLLAVGIVPPIVSIIIICVILLILGCFMDPVAIMMITVPIFYPIAMTLGYDPIWFGVIMVFLTNLACITPPFGIILFALKGVTGIPTDVMYRGVTPFILISLFVLMIILFFPQAFTFLPNLLM
jgi:tripartite ATP-independent transporter DctM subunit